MAATPPFPYETRVNILHQPLEVIDEKALADACQFDWYNQTLCKVNESVVRLGVVQGEYHWHRYDQDDEFFYVVDGQLSIDLEGRTIELSSRQGFVVPKGVLHRTRAARRTVILMVENAGIIPTGDAPPNDRSRLVSPEAGELLGTNLADTFQIPDHSRS